MRTWLVLGVWAVGSAAALWQFVYRYALPAAPESKVVAAPSLGKEESSKGPVDLAPSGQVTLLDFTSSDCGCSAYIRDHVESLISTYGPKGVRFIRIVESKESVTSGVPTVADPHGAIARRFGVGATPAAVIIDAHRQIRYIGSYNRARFCSDHETAFAQLALEAVVHGQEPKLARTPFFGCAVPAK
jgi:hypothetical protein